LGFGSDQDDIMEQVSEGDTFWIVGRSKDDNEWRLLQRVHVAKRYTDKGMQRVLADSDKSEFFDPANQSDFEPVLKNLEFASENGPIVADGKLVGQHIQRLRMLSAADATRLQEYAAGLSGLG
jgi:hypothetical protein